MGRFGGFSCHVFGLDDAREGNQYNRACHSILALIHEIVDAQRDGQIFGFAHEPDEADVATTLGDVTITVRNAPKLYTAMLLDAGVVLPQPPEIPNETVGTGLGQILGDSRPFGIILQLDTLEFLVIGQGALFDFYKAGSELEVNSVQELRLTSESWQVGRFLNGDERLQVLQGDKITGCSIKLLEIQPA